MLMRPQLANMCPPLPNKIKSKIISLAPREHIWGVVHTLLKGGDGWVQGHKQVIRYQERLVCILDIPYIYIYATPPPTKKKQKLDFLVFFLVGGYYIYIYVYIYIVLLLYMFCVCWHV